MLAADGFSLIKDPYGFAFTALGVAGVPASLLVIAATVLTGRSWVTMGRQSVGASRRLFTGARQATRQLASEPAGRRVGAALALLCVPVAQVAALTLAYVIGSMASWAVYHDQFTEFSDFASRYDSQGTLSLDLLFRSLRMNYVSEIYLSVAVLDMVRSYRRSIRSRREPVIAIAAVPGFIIGSMAFLGAVFPLGVILIIAVLDLFGGTWHAGDFSDPASGLLAFGILFLFGFGYFMAFSSAANAAETLVRAWRARFTAQGSTP